VNIVAFAAHHARTVVLGTVLVVGAGLVSAWNLPSSIYPPLEFPRIVIIARSGTLPSQSMMLTVTRPIETAVMEVPGIRRVRSTSIRGATEISAQFDPATDMVLALQQVQNRVAEVRGELPADTDRGRPPGADDGGERDLPVLVEPAARGFQHVVRLGAVEDGGGLGHRWPFAFSFL
jgi:multidrug efflux pump subunit AcrB